MNSLAPLTDAVISLDEKYKVLANREIPSPKHTFGYEFPDPKRFLSFLNLNNNTLYAWNTISWVSTNVFQVQFIDDVTLQHNKRTKRGLLPNHGSNQELLIESLSIHNTTNFSLLFDNILTLNAFEHNKKHQILYRYLHLYKGEDQNYSIEFNLEVIAQPNTLLEVELVHKYFPQTEIRPENFFITVLYRLIGK